jgi:hypothetical protein
MQIFQFAFQAAACFLCFLLAGRNCAEFVFCLLQFDFQSGQGFNLFIEGFFFPVVAINLFLQFLRGLQGFPQCILLDRQESVCFFQLTFLVLEFLQFGQLLPGCIMLLGVVFK